MEKIYDIKNNDMQFFSEYDIDKRIKPIIDNEFIKPLSINEANVEKSIFEKISLKDIVDIKKDDFRFEYNFDSKKLNDILFKFDKEIWNGCDNNLKKEYIKNLKCEICNILDLNDDIILKFENMADDASGYYDPRKNSIYINKNLLSNPFDLIETIAHEIKHAHQNVRANKMETYEDKIYAYNDLNYIEPKFDKNGNMINFNEYATQYIEAEAEAFAERIGKIYNG